MQSVTQHSKLTEEHYQKIISISDGIIVTDVDGNVVFSNDAVTEVLRVEKQYQKKSIYFNTKLKRQRHIEQSIQQIVKKAVASPREHTLEYELKHSSKCIKIFNYQTSTGHVLYISDDTANRARKEILEQSATVADSLIDVAPIGFALLDSKLRFLRVNNELATMNHLSAQDHLGKEISSVFPDFPKNLIRIMKKVLITNEPVLNLDVEMNTVVGSEPECRKYVASYFPVFLDDKSITLLGVLLRDVTERRRVEKQLELTKANLTYLSEASKILSSSLDYHTTLQTVSKLAVPKVADWCSIDLLNEDQEITQVAVHHKDPKKIKWAKALRKNSAPKIDDPDGVGSVLRTGNELYYPYISEELIKQRVQDEEQLEIVKQIGFSSIIIVPIIIEQKTIGAITFVTAESKRRLNESDLDMARELASRASLCIHNALLYEKVANEGKRLDDLITSVPGIVWEAKGEPDSPNQRIAFISQYAEEMLGYRVEEWLREPQFWHKIVVPEDKNQASSIAQKTFNNGEVGVNRFRWRKKDGDIIWVETHSSVIKNKKGKKIGMTGVTMDITDRMAIEQQKDEFIGIVSHELKTPVTSLKAYAQVLQRRFSKNNDNVAAFHLQKMDNQLNKLTVLINDLLDVTKIEAGKLKLFKEEFDIHALIQEIVEQMKLTTQSHKFEVPKVIQPVSVFADRERIGQVLINLLSNAVKYSPQAEHVEITVEEQENQISIGVKDFGVGIPKEKVDAIFDRFYRVSGTRRESFPGMGLGLYISSEIVKRHGGRIWVESTIHKGSQFFFTIPK